MRFVAGAFRAVVGNPEVQPPARRSPWSVRPSLGGRPTRRVSAWCALSALCLAELLGQRQPDTFLRWHRKGFRLLWRWKSRPLSVYRERGHPRLPARTYEEKCTTCMWGYHMAVAMIVDQWNPSQRRYRTETFCYGPRRCPFYRSGPARKVPGRRGMTHTEEDWIDEEATSRRGPDE